MSGSVPDFFTVEEAAKVLRIGRGAAYALARQWRATGGEEGLPVIALGKSLRVPRAALERLCGGPLLGHRPTPEPEAPPSKTRTHRVRLPQDGLPLET
jgi:excisionase family DNA binding protein